MTIDTQLYLLTGGLSVLGLVSAWQAWRLRMIYRSRSSWIGMVTFLLLGGRQAYSLFRLRTNISDARARGAMIDHLTIEQWIVGVLWVYAIMIGFVAWQHWQHRELERSFGI